ncbi:trypsin-like serine protease [Paraglaciecola sp.]|uniref:S1 family peptidase n=1 Tax=Paraglaciecola sp. TaxID=1920173 RepID=UPI0030F44D50
MKIIQYICLTCVLLFSFSSKAIVVRHDVQAKSYVLEETPTFIVDMPGGGHGALIAPNWVVTVAHLISPNYIGNKIQIGEHIVEVEKVIVHPGVKEIPENIISGETSGIMDYLISSHDIALLKLSTNLPDVAPIEIYAGNEELGKIITGFGKGTTGDGNIGSISGTQKEGVLRQLQNRIEETHSNWLSITFDKGDDALHLEGIDGSWDSGGPLIMTSHGKNYLVGLFSWDYIEGNASEFIAGLYGNKSYQVRISTYSDWLRKTMSEN